MNPQIFNQLSQLVLVNIVFLLINNGQVFGKDTKWCGIPALPARGNITPYNEQFENSEVITYTCKEGYFLLGPDRNTCRRGKWDVPAPPLCGKNQAYKRRTRLSTSMNTNSFLSSYAVDGKYDTCAATRSDDQQRWLSVDLGKKAVEIEYVKIVTKSDSAIFNFTIEITNFQTRSSKICQHIYRPQKYTTFEKKLDCIGNATEVTIRDKRTNYQDGFHLCEVEIYSKRDYKCGEPERPLNCFSVNISTIDEQRIKYRARPGYTINQEEIFVCIDGKWKGDAIPECSVKTNPAYPDATKIPLQDKDKNSTENVNPNFIVGVAIGVTAASISTIVVIVIVVVIMRKYYKRNDNCHSGTISDADAIFLRANPPSSIGSCSPTIQPTYSRPWDDPNQHMYDYICTDSLPRIQEQELPPLPKDADLNIDRCGYLAPRTSTKRQYDSNDRSVCRSLLDVPYRIDDRSIPINGRVNSFNEIEVDAYGYPETDDTCRV